MATIEKRKNEAGEISYRVKIRLTGYPPETETFERMTDAKEWAARTESNIKAGRHFGMSKRFTFGQLVDSVRAAHSFASVIRSKVSVSGG